MVSEPGHRPSQMRPLFFHFQKAPTSDEELPVGQQYEGTADSAALQNYWGQKSFQILFMSGMLFFDILRYEDALVEFRRIGF